MRKPDLPYLTAKKSKGKTYWYFRRGKSWTRIKGEPDSEDFMSQYWAIRSGRAKPNIKTTWDKLITHYLASPAFLSLKPGTRADYQRHCGEIRAKNGPKDIRQFRRKHAIAARDTLSDTWSKANMRVAVLSRLMAFAVDLEWIERNPVVDIPKLKGGEYEAWPDDKLRAFEHACDASGNVIARTIYELAIGTGQRLGDCVAMKWSDFDGEFMTVKQEKTGEPLDVYCPERLQQFLSQLPRSGRHIIAKNLTQPLGNRRVQKEVERVRIAINIMSGESRLVPHGWRYTAAKSLADAGCSDAEIQSVTGHRTLEMVQKYRKQAGQRDASRRAQQRVERNKNKT